MNHLYCHSIFMVLLFSLHISFAHAGNDTDAGHLATGSFAEAGAAGDLSASITGAVTFCKGAAGAAIIFEGSGGADDYTFTYQIDGGADQSISTLSQSNSVNVPVNTSIARDIIYRITGVKGATGKTTPVDITRVITILAGSVVDFSSSGNACSGTPVLFTPTVQGAGNYTYYWDFGDGQNSAEQNPSHVFSSLGCGAATFTVSLTVTDSNGCSSTRSRQVSILQKPDISFSDLNFPFGDPFNNCGSASSTLNYTIRVGNISASAGCVSSYTIDWGDGSAPVAGAAFPATHTYTRLGAFDMVITAQGTNGCSSTVTYVVRNLNNPSVGITSPGTTTNLCAPTAPLGFEIAKWGTNSPGTTYRVDYGDGSPILILTQEQLKASDYYVAANPSASANYPIPHSYIRPNCPNGPYMVRLTATNACSSTEATVNNITVFNKTTPDFSAPSHTCANTNVVFVNTSIPGYNTSCNQTSIYTWDFGDGTVVEVTSPTMPKNTGHTYTTPGQYTVTLSAKNICGESSTTRVITIDPPMTASIAGTGVVSGTVTVCQDASMPVITFTGTNGTAPYTFTYQINNGPLQTVTTQPGARSATVTVLTNAVGSFTYTLVNVSDTSAAACSQVQTGSVTVVVSAPPTGTISGNTSACLNDVSPVITFTGSGGTRPYTFTYNINGGPSTTITTQGSSNSVTLAVPTTSAGVYKYNLTGVQDAGAGSCSRAVSASATITISPLPAPMTLSDYAFCNGEATPVISFSNTVAGTTYRWTNSNTSIGLPASGIGSIASFTARNTTGNPVSAIITVTPSVNGCEGASQTFVITVNPAAIQFSQGAQAICSGDQTTEVLLSNPAGAAISWTAQQPAGVTGVITSGTNTIPVQTLVNTTSAPLTVTYTAMATLPATDPCAGTRYSYSITVNPRPDIQQAFNPEICSGSLFSVSPQVNADNMIPAGTRYTWSAPVIAPSGAITGASVQASPQANISQTLVNTTGAAATATYLVTPMANGCEGVSFTIVVTVLPLPKAAVSGSATVCQDAPMPLVTFTGSNGTAPYTFTYRINNGPLQTVTTDQGSSSKSVQVPTATPSSFTYTLLNVTEASLSTCSQVQSGSVTVTVSAPPSGTISGSNTVCLNDDSPLITFTGSGGSGSYIFTYTLNGGTPVTTNPTGASGSITVAVPTTTAGVYRYNLTGVQDAGAGSCTRAVNASAAVTISPLPALMTLSDYTFCNGAATPVINFSNTVAGTVYRWTNSNTSTGLPASGTGSIASFTALNATSSPISSTVTVTPSVNGCNGLAQSFTITVYPSPVVTFSPNSQTLCSGESTGAVTLASSTAGVQFSWTAIQPAGLTGVITSGTSTIPEQTLVNTTGSPITVTYKAKAVTSGAVSCSGSEYSYTITVNPMPQVKELIASEICSGNTFSVALQNNTNNILPAGTRYTWSAPVIAPVGAITGASAQASPQANISQSLVNTTGAAATVTYSVTPIANGCEGDSFTIVVTVLPRPSVNPVSSFTLCSGDQAAAILFSGKVPGAVYRWTSDNPSIGIAGSGTDKIDSFTAVNTGNSPVQTTITVTPVLLSGSVSCEEASVQFTITVNPRAQVNDVDNRRVCSGKPLSISFSTQNTQGTTTYEWINSNTAIGLGASGSGDLSFVPVNTDNTTLSAVITVTPVYSYNGISCKGDAKTFRVEVDPLATVVKPMDQVVCNGHLTQEIRFGGNSSNTIYQWTTDNSSVGLAVGGSGTIMPFMAVNNGTVPVVVSITVTPVLNGCSGMPASFTITVNPTPAIITQPAGSVVCLGEKPAMLSVAVRGTGTPSYQWYASTTASASEGVILPNATLASFDPPASAAGTVYYYCVITFPGNDCNELTSAAAGVTILPNPVISAMNQQISSGETFTVLPSWGDGNVVPAGTTYIWSAPVVSPAGSVSGASAQSVPQPAISQRLVNTTMEPATVTYTVFPVSGSCTGASFKVTVYVDSPLVPNVTLLPITCFGINSGSITTRIQGGAPFATGDPYTILWTGPNGFTSTDASIFNLSPGLYHLSVTDSRGKEFSADYTVLAPEELLVRTDEKQDVTCYGQADGRISITVDGGTGPYQTVWTRDNAPFAATEDIAQLSPGTYEVTVSDANGCAPKIMSWVITQPEPLAINLTGRSDIRCFNDSTGSISVEVTGGVLVETAPGVFGYRYRWSGPAGFTSSKASLRNLAAGEYHLLVIDGAGCSQSLQVILMQPSPVTVGVQTTPISCFGANNATISLDITGGVPPYRTEWNNYATGTYQDNLSAGDYTILVTDANQCQLFTTVHIPEAQLFKVNPAVKNVSCYGARNGSISLNFETTLKSVILTWSDNVRTGTTRNNIGPGTYTVYIQGEELCMINRTFIITEPQPLVLSGAVTDIADCSSVDGGAIDLMVTGGTPPYRYAWSNGAVSEDLRNLQAGNYAITVTDSMGCSQIAQYAVKRPLPLVMDVTTRMDFNCATGEIKAISTASVSGGVTPYRLNWSAGTISGSNDEQMETSQSGIFLLTVTDQSGCIMTRSLPIDIPTPGITSRLTDCQEHVFQFNGVPAVESEAISYSWDFGDGTVSSLRNPQHTYGAAGTYNVRLTVAGAGPCVSEYDQEVTAALPPVVGIDKDPRFCPGDSVLVYGTGAESYRWNDGTTSDSIWIKREGPYSVTGTSPSGCLATYDFTASYFDLIGYTIQSDQQEVSTGANRIHFWSENIPYSSYRWDFGDGLSGQGSDIFHGYEINEDGYFDVTLIVINPNGCEETTTHRIWKSVTAIANTFTPNSDGINDIYLKGWQIEVFNRNGVLMYKGDKGWDGKHDGRLVDNDTYFVIIYDSTQQGAKYKKSYVTVLR